VTVDLEATLAIATPDLGLSGLPGEASRVLVNGGTLRFKASGNVFRGFTIGAEGTTLSVDAGMSVRFTGSQQIASAVGGDLMVQGDGTALLGKSLGGNGDVIKSGGGTLTLSTANTYAGETIVHGGLLSVLGTTGSGNTIIGVDGTITGTGNVSGSLVVDGIVAPGPSTGMLGVLGDFTQTSTGTLQIELRGSGSGLFDVLNVGGSANVDGSLQIVLQDGFVPTEGTLFPILNAAGVAGTLDLVGDASGFTLLSSSGGLALYFGALPAGDYDQNGTVEAADYDVWKAAYGTATAMGTGADGNGDGIVDAGDFTIWRDNLGATVFTEGAGGSSLSVPEPNSIFFAAVVLAIVGTLRSHEPR
jgi:autotransporter-associated beta strand protein